MSPRPFPLRPILVVWFVLAIGIAVVMPAPQAPPPLRLLLILGPVAAFVVASRASPRLRETLDAIEPRRIVALHAVRAAIGATFLVLGTRGQLPREFAVPAGIGDLTVGSAALVGVVAWPWIARHGRGLLLAWNVAGILDFINVQRIATFTLRGREAEFHAFQHLPLSAVPYFVVPVLFATHVYLIAKLARRR